MKLLVVTCLFVTIAATKNVSEEIKIDLDDGIPYGYLTRIGVPLAKQVLKAETQSAVRKIRKIVKFERIVDGSGAHLGEFPYQAGIISEFRGMQGICGGSLLNRERVLTAAHCWWDGKDQADSLTVVLGSVKLYTGGTRLRTSKVTMHGKYDPWLRPYDIAMIYLPQAVKFSNTIQPIALPYGPDARSTFADQKAVVSGFGCTRNVYSNTNLYHVKLQVISNEQCGFHYNNVRPVEMCTRGANFENVCNGDSGGPLALIKGDKRILIGVVAFGKSDSLDGSPSGFTRVSAFINWIKTFL